MALGPSSFGPRATSQTRATFFDIEIAKQVFKKIHKHSNTLEQTHKQGIIHTSQMPLCGGPKI